MEKIEEENELLGHKIWEHFGNIKDPRMPDNQKYSFKSLIVGIVCAIICGANSVASILNYIESKIDWFRETWGFEKTPSYNAIWWLLVLMEPKAFNEGFISMAKELGHELSEEEKLSLEKEGIAIDGKTSRGTAREDVKALHLVSAWSTKMGFVLGQMKTAEKSNEITAIPKLLKLLEIKDKVITIDAMGCQSAIAKQIVEQEGDYILALKGNQEAMHEEVKDLFEKLPVENHNRDMILPTIEKASEIDKGHGRIEQREARVCSDLPWLKANDQWDTIASVIEITSKRTVKGKTTEEKRYYLSSIKAPAKQFLKWIRGHWGVESFHWTLDVTFRNDEFQGYTGNLAENFSLLQKLALNLLKKETSLKKSIPQKRFRAGWNNDYLMKVLGM